MLNCILAGLLAAGITLSVIVVAALVIVLATGTAGTGAAVAAAVAALLAEWWISIAASLLFALAAAFTLCIGGDVGVTDAGGSTTIIGLSVGASLASAIIVGEWKLGRWRPRVR